MQNLPEHVAIVMDGNGRWAKQRHLPRVAGHRAGVEAVRKVVKAAAEKQIQVLSLFAFSTENWHRPQQEVSYLLEVLLNTLQREAVKLHENNIQIKVIGGLDKFSKKIQEQINHAQQLTAENTGLKLVIAANYGGQWDILQATKALAKQVQQGDLQIEAIDNEIFAKQLSLNSLPNPDLFIRTSGELRISNFFLWQLAYTELYFIETLWPDFSEKDFQLALEAYAERKRRFGKTNE